MRYLLHWVLIICFAAVPVGAKEKAINNPKVELETSKGKIVLELYPAKAPETVKNFLLCVDTKFYDSTIFHRVIPKFMIQGGGFTADMKRKPGRAPIKNEADNGLKNDRGTIAMARTREPHSAAAQFFINTVNNDFLNFKSKDLQGWGYAVFGRVASGMQVVDAISRVKTGGSGRYRDVPVEPVVILKARRLK
jgi:cyclophilin family peptidyl-prolyl cis-trans isomerase